MPQPGISAVLPDLSQTLLETAGIRAEAKADGVSVLDSLRGEPIPSHQNFLFFGGWHVGVNFASGLARSFPDGRFLLYSYNCRSQQDELYDLNAVDSANLIRDPGYAMHRDEMIRALGIALQSDPRWTGYWAEFRIARYNALPKSRGDMQLFTVSS